MNAQERKKKEIAEKSAKPIAVGDRVDISIPFITTKTVGKGKNKTTEDVVEYKSSIGTVPYGTNLMRGEWLKQNIDFCGSDPFAKNVPRVNFFNQDISSMLYRCEYDDNHGDHDFSFKRKVIDSNNEPKYIGKSHGGLNFDPTVIDADGNVQHYQRGLVWSMEQKQQLINSIYLQVEIGKFVFRKRSWRDIERGMAGPGGHGYHYDCCDGKQRLHAILEFVSNQYPDLQGNYFRDLSRMAQRRFLRFDRLSYGELDEGTTDKQVLATFLNLNFAGTPIAESHTKFVQSIKM